MNNSAFLIIDMQEGAVKMTNPSFYEIDTVVRRLKKVLKAVRAKKIPVIYAQHFNPSGYPEYGSTDWQIIDELAPLKGDLIIHKSSPDVFLDTGLDEHLKEMNINSLIVAGIQTADCIDTTCRVAFRLGYKVTLIKDGHTTFDSQHLKAPEIINHHNQIIENWFGEVVKAADLVF